MMLVSVLLLAVAFLALGTGALAAGTQPPWTVAVYGGALLLAVVGALVALASLTTGTVDEVVLPLGLPRTGLRFRLDGLAAFFLLVLDLGAVVACLFALGYGRHEPRPRRVLPFVPAFLGAMHLVLVADDAFAFLFTWELMSLCSWALVVSRPDTAENARAGYVYLVMAGLGTAALLLAMGILAGSDGGYAFAEMRAAEREPWLAAVAVGLILVGTGSKAGLVPLHAWLPLAHPAAPSHVSALMSGVMTKVAVYAALRLILDVIGEVAWWWGPVLMLLGAASAVLGLLHAILETDLKRLLAYSTVENIGVIFTAFGLAIAFRGAGLQTGAALALTAALLHVLNHAFFKSLLFMGAGAVLEATGERDMERLGGLIHAMPLTAAAMLLGSAAISALPPLNGFVSEWLLFQAILQSPAVDVWALRFLTPAVGALLALAAALAAACFVRAYGIVFLGRPRSPAAAAGHEVDRWSLAGLGAAALPCVLLGVFPGPVIDLLAPAVATLTGGATLATQGGQGWLSLVPVDPAHSSYNGLILLTFILVSGSLVAFAVHRLASHRVARGPIWDCGYPDPSPATQYTASSFGQPLRRVFGSVAFSAREQVEMPAPGDLGPARLEVHLRDHVWTMLYAPVAGVIDALSERLNVIQFLTIRRYLTMMFGALVFLLVVVAVWR